MAKALWPHDFLSSWLVERLVLAQCGLGRCGSSKSRMQGREVPLRVNAISSSVHLESTLYHLVAILNLLGETSHPPLPTVPVNLSFKMSCSLSQATNGQKTYILKSEYWTRQELKKQMKTDLFQGWHAAKTLNYFLPYRFQGQFYLSKAFFLYKLFSFYTLYPRFPISFFCLKVATLIFCC